MGQEWQSQFAFYMNLGNPPTTEQLHKLVLIDSVNITGRASITSLQPVSKLVMLRVLFCQTTGITTLDPLKDLTELQVINTSNTAITSLQPLTGNMNLQMLSIDNTKVSDLSPLYGLQ